MWGRGPRSNKGTCSTLCGISVTSPTTHNQIGPFWCWFLGGWACACLRPLWVSPKNSPVRLGVSPTASTPTCVFSQRFEALFPRTGALGLRGLFCSPFVPPGLSTCECGTTGSTSHRLAASPLHSAAHLRPSYLSGWVFLLYLLGCRTSIQFDFMSVLVGWFFFF